MKVTRTHVILLVATILLAYYFSSLKEPYQHYDGECNSCNSQYEPATQSWSIQQTFFNPIKHYVRVPNLWGNR